MAAAKKIGRGHHEPRAIMERIGAKLNRRYMALEDFVAEAPQNVRVELMRLERELAEALERAENEGMQKLARRF